VARILVVDDQAHVRAAIAVALRSNGFEVVGVEDAVSAFGEFEFRPFDLAIVDVYMPSIDGLKLVKSLRERWPGLPIIIISGVTLNESQLTALDFLPKLSGFGQVTCLKKPFRSAELLKLVSAAFGVAA
jgi:DNA-binding response OmpR family regulator